MGSGSIYLKSNTVVHGDGIGKTMLYYSSTTGGVYEGSFQGGFECSSITNSEIYGFTFHSDCPNEDSTGRGDGRACIDLSSSNHIKIHDCSIVKYVYSDFITCRSSSYIDVYNNTGQCGHDFVQGISHSNYVHVWNCNIWIADNSGVRSDYGTNFMIDHCTFTNTQGGGNACFEAEDTISNNTVTKCVFHDLSNPISINVHASGDLHVTDNRGWSCGSVGYGTSTLNQLSVSNHDLNYWIGQGYGAGASTDDGGGSIPPTPPPTPGIVYNGSVIPTLITPANGSDINTVNGNVTYSWSDVNSTSYHIYVSTDSSFTNITYNTYISDPSISLAMSQGTYYWRISAHDDAHNSWTANTTTFYHVIAGNIVASTGVYGVIYDTDSTKHPIEGAVVSLMNGTWSSTLVTDSDGAYTFSVPPSTGLYWIIASATGYQSIPESPGLPLNMTGDYVHEDIALTKSPSYFEPHYVSFRVINTNAYTIFTYGVLLKGADVQAYAMGNDPMNSNPDFEGTTGSDGVVSFSLSQNVNYTVVTTYNNTVDTEFITPVNSGYTIYMSIPDITSTPVQPFGTTTNVTVTQNQINDTAAYVNITYTDYNNASTLVTFNLGQLNGTNNFNYLNITGIKDSWTQAEMVNGVATDSLIVNNYIGETYAIETNITSGTYGSITETTTTQFPLNNLPFTNTLEFSLVCIFVVLVILTQFGKWDADKALVIGPLVMLVECLIGGFNGLNPYIPSASTAAMTFGFLGLCFGVINYMTSSRG